jgi:N-carbamoyl-L-amino-acid hydrolase
MAKGTEVLRAQLARGAARRGVAIELSVTGVVEPTSADPALKAALARAAARVGQSTLDIDSGAGHDAQAVSHLTPVGMLFVPSRAGVSHCPREWSSPEDLVRGAQVLAEALADLTSPEAWGTAGGGPGQARRQSGAT